MYIVFWFEFRLDGAFLSDIVLSTSIISFCLPSPTLQNNLGSSPILFSNSLTFGTLSFKVWIDSFALTISTCPCVPVFNLLILSSSLNISSIIESFFKVSSTLKPSLMVALFSADISKPNLLVIYLSKALLYSLTICFLVLFIYSTLVLPATDGSITTSSTGLAPSLALISPLAAILRLSK